VKAVLYVRATQNKLYTDEKNTVIGEIKEYKNRKGKIRRKNEEMIQLLCPASTLHPVLASEALPATPASICSWSTRYAIPHHERVTAHGEFHNILYHKHYHDINDFHSFRQIQP